MVITQWELRRGNRETGLRVLLCDDDQDFLAAFRQEVEKHLEKLNMRASLEVFSRGEDISEDTLAQCDLAFLDIDLENSEKNGMDLARKLRGKNEKALIFFVTNFIDYAPEGFEVQAFRYILKRDREAVLERYLMQAMELLAEGQEALRLTGPDAYMDLPLGEILYLEVLDHSVSIHRAKQMDTVSATLSSFEQRLGEHGFLRIHKSYLVNMAHIRRFRSRECVLSDGTVLMVSEKNYAQQKQKYLLWKGLK